MSDAQLDRLIDALDLGGSAQNTAIDELAERGPQIVPVLMARLESELDADLATSRRWRHLTATWDQWYDEMDTLSTDNPGASAAWLGSHTSVQDLPRREDLEGYPPSRPGLKRGLIKTLHRLGDQQASDVIATALDNSDCVDDAARALVDIRSEHAVPRLLGAATLDIGHFSGVMFSEALLRALRSYQVSIEDLCEFAQTEGPTGRFRLWHLSRELFGGEPAAVPDCGLRDALVFLSIDPYQVGISEAVKLLCELDGIPAPDDDPYGSLPPAVVIESAIAIAARDQPQGWGLPLRKYLRLLLRNTDHDRAPYAQALTTILGKSGTGAESADLHFALELARRFPSADSHFSPGSLTALIYPLTRHPDPKVRTRARTVLIKGRGIMGGLLTHDRLHTDPTVRAAAEAMFDELADEDDHRKFAQHAKLTRGRLRTIVDEIQRTLGSRRSGRD